MIHINNSSDDLSIPRKIDTLVRCCEQIYFWMILSKLLSLYCYKFAAQVTMPMARNECIFPTAAWYYGDNDFIIRTFNFIAPQEAMQVTCSTWYRFSCDLRIVKNTMFLWTVHSCKTYPLTPILCIAETFEGENFCKFHSFVAIRKSVLRENRIFSPIHKVFSLESFPLYGRFAWVKCMIKLESMSGVSYCCKAGPSPQRGR